MLKDPEEFEEMLVEMLKEFFRENLFELEGALKSSGLIEISLVSVLDGKEVYMSKINRYEVERAVQLVDNSAKMVV